MSLFIASLNSGSNGNCYYVGNQHDAVLIDVGISCRELEKRLLRLELSIKKVKAVFISHEHTDHISGLETLAKKHQLPVYITEKTFTNSKLEINENLRIDFEPFQAITIGALQIIPFPKQHDAIHPHSFIVKAGNVTVGILTDIGKACKNVVNHFKMCNAVFLETNYDDEMLEKGHYPFRLKKRIRGDEGHLSNFQALELFRKHKPSFMSHLLISHLSKENNHPELVLQLFEEHAAGTKIIHASRDAETEVFQIHPSQKQQKKAIPAALNKEQLSLF